MTPLSYLKEWQKKRRSRVSSSNQVSIADHSKTNPHSNEQVEHFLNCLKLETDIHPTLLADISPPADINNAAEDGEETARIITNFIHRYAAQNNLRSKDQSLAHIGMGQLRQAATDWASENLADDLPPETSLVLK